MLKFLMLLTLPFLLSAQTTAPATQPQPINITVVGASIAAGFGTDNHATDSYPAQLQSLLGPAYALHNFALSGRTLLKKADRPYTATKQYQQALHSSPDLVIIDLGGNDSKPDNWKSAGPDFEADSRALISSFQSLPSHPRIILLLPFPFRPHNSTISDNIITHEQIPIFQKLATEMHLQLVDMHTPFVDKQSWFLDGIHPNKTGHTLAAQILHSAILPPTTQPTTNPQ